MHLLAYAWTVIRVIVPHEGLGGPCHAVRGGAPIVIVPHEGLGGVACRRGRVDFSSDRSP